MKMKLGILLSGGKDSVYAAYLASQTDELACAITIVSENEESYMFHTPNIEWVKLQAESMGLPLIIVKTKGEKEKELSELATAIAKAQKEHGIEGVITGAVASQYQASRVQKICAELDLFCLNPLWQIDQVKLLRNLLRDGFDIIISGVFGYPLDESFLGAKIDEAMIKQLIEFSKKYKLNPAGEGGEIETFVIDCPLFEKKIIIDESSKKYDNHSGNYYIEKAHMKVSEIKENSKYPLWECAAKPEVLVVSTTAHEIFEHEFVRPITDILTECNVGFRVAALEELKDASGVKVAIITGTAFKDNEFLKHKHNFKELKIPILGICAGAELLLPEDCVLEKIIEIGPVKLEELNEDNLTSNLEGKEAYFLHQHGIRGVPLTNELVGLLATKEGIAAFKWKEKEHYGFQFHPEVSQKEIIRKYIWQNLKTK